MQRRFLEIVPIAVLAAVSFSGCSLLHHGGSGQVQAAAPLQVIPLPSSVYNLADSNPAYLRLGVSVALGTPAGKDPSSLQSVTRDTLVTLVSAQTSDVLLTAAGKTALKKALVAELRKRLPEAKIEDVYFDEFLVQR